MKPFALPTKPEIAPATVIATVARLALALFAMGLLCTQAFAQSTAQPSIPGYLTTTGCPPGFTSCFVQYGSSIPTSGGGAGQGTPTDKGGTITTGGTSQTAVAANTSRKSAVCMNPVNATEDLYVAITGAATVAGAGNYADLAPGGSATILGTSAVSLNAATSSHRFLCTEWQ